MIPTRPPQTRYATTSRRTLHARQAAIAALMLVPGLACGNNDAEVFGSASTHRPSSVPVGTSAVETAVTTTSDTVTEIVESTTLPTLDSTTSAPSSIAQATVDNASFPDAAELAVSFSFVPEPSGGRGVESPYIAVWVEDLDGNLVQTISLWYEQTGKGGKWLSDLPQWYSASDRGDDVTMSGATRVAGDYTVVWDGTGLDGAPVAQGEYVLFVEAAREHGPYGITSQQISIGNNAFAVDLAADGELANVSASLIA